MTKALTSSATLENTIARSDNIMKQSLTITMVKPSLKKAKSQLLRSKQQMLQSTKSDQLEAIYNTCIYIYMCAPDGDDVHIPVHIEKTIACSDV